MVTDSLSYNEFNKMVLVKDIKNVLEYRNDWYFDFLGNNKGIVQTQTKSVFIKVFLMALILLSK
ncbi:hypothetical protein DF947_08270 [Pedobacter paludis]|uniref:Uncharacterized protein n=1 Tax=Pedobacter paludis TaxID=2203212 RepID=A0A317EZ56_9SPHI|nr:hypothetical protein DF947_08270 [Pedobacter paludis]